jgi:hypothetical protein
MPLTRSLRSIVQLSRPLRASDMAPTNEATADTPAFLDRQRVELVRNSMQTTRTDLATFQAALEALLADIDNRRDELLANLDRHIEELSALLARAADFGVTQAGWSFAYDLKRRVFASILRRCADLAARWNDRLDQFDAQIAAHDNLPAAATDQEKFDVLQRAERCISTTPVTPLPAAPVDFKATLLAKRALFASRLLDFSAIQSTHTTSLAELRTDVHRLIAGPPPLADFDATALTLTEDEDQMTRFAEDAVRVSTVVVAELDRRLAASQTLLDQHDAAAQPASRVTSLTDATKALLGDDFVVVPEFELTANQGDEIQNALDASTSGTLFDYLQTRVDVPFPVDTWLYGIARVREKMRAWEQLVMLTGAFGIAEAELSAIQLPFVADDNWLALQVPPGLKLDIERLLYSAHFAAPFDKRSRQCGLLIDEWSEVIPSTTTTTGITFQYDRPNSEAPQTMLLVTPAEFTGAWRWADFVDAVNETLNLAKSRAVEPAQVEKTPYTCFLPAVISAVTSNQLTPSVNLALNNHLHQLT